MNKILLVGCGHMGSALLSSWFKKTSFSFSVIDPNNYKNIKKKYSKKVSVFKTIEAIQDINKFNIIIFAIKPQIAKQVISEFHSISNKNILFISIVAGKRFSFFDKYFNTKKQIVRVMPNMPALVERGMSCLVSNKLTSKKNKKIAKKLFDIVGKTIWLKKESDLDKITAISGSGPAYLFMFIEYFESVARDLGFTSVIAKQLVYQTALGSIELLVKDMRSAKQLKESIAVKGGTTEAAINVFEKNSLFKKIIKNAIKNAYHRSIKLGEN